MIVFRERLAPMQLVATVLAGIGVVFFLVVNGGDIWIVLVLAISFSIYGAVKKRGGYPALPGMAFESLLTGVLGCAILAAGAVRADAPAPSALSAPAPPFHPGSACPRWLVS